MPPRTCGAASPGDGRETGSHRFHFLRGGAPVLSGPGACDAHRRRHPAPGLGRFLVSRRGAVSRPGDEGAAHPERPGAPFQGAGRARGGGRFRPLLHADPGPDGGSCSHPCGTGLAAILIGPGITVVVASTALLLQALFLAHGGLTTLGANLVSMGVVGAYLGSGVFLVARKVRIPWLLAAFLAGLVSDWGTYATTSFELSAALARDGSMGSLFLPILAAFAPTQVPLGIFEGSSPRAPTG